jgi:hypothetical protein
MIAKRDSLNTPALASPRAYSHTRGEAFFSVVAQPPRLCLCDSQQEDTGEGAYATTKQEDTGESACATTNTKWCQRNPAIQQSSNPAIQQSSNPAIQQSSNPQGWFFFAVMIKCPTCQDC